MLEAPATAECRHHRLVDIVRRVDCSHGIQAVDAVQELASKVGIAVRIRDIVIHTDEEAKARRCLGSPTILVSGLDVEPEARARSSFAVT